MNDRFTLHHGNCLRVMQDIPDESVDLILCDLPYNTTSIDWDILIPFEPLWGQYSRILKREGCAVMFGSQPFTTHLISSNLDWFRYELIWNKNKCGSPGLAKMRPMKTHENICIFYQYKHTYNPQMEVGEPYRRKPPKQVRCNNHGYGFSNDKEIVNEGTRYPKSILDISRDFSAQQQIHPTQKPVTLLNWLVKTYSNPDEVVLDNCMGSGSTGVACAESGRKFIGIELEKEYFDIAAKRIEDAMEKKNSSVDTLFE